MLPLSSRVSLNDSIMHVPHCGFLLLCAGPACKEVDTLMKMMNEGMCVARLNFSHGDYEASYHLLPLP